jgi:epoxyqueuosine reductase
MLLHAVEGRPALNVPALWTRMQVWAAELGFSRIGVADLAVGDASTRLQAWLDAGMHGSMAWMRRHASLRGDPRTLVPGALRAVTVRMDYLPSTLPADNMSWRSIEWQRIEDPASATVSIYARGRDYHKVVRARLQRLADRIAAEVGPFGHRAFTDSAPVLEVEMATRSGLAWRGKHTLALSRDAGSAFFLGELFVDLPLEPTPPVDAHCGTCSACIDVCPTRAIVAPYVLDARRCIAYLTIEHEGPIPVELRPLIGNRVFGCDDCQLACPWNKHAQRAVLPDFDVRAAWRDPKLLDLWSWDEATFLRRTEGTVLRRSGFERWRRNLAVSLGNTLGRLSEPDRPSAPGSAARDADAVVRALAAARPGASSLVAQHIDWALAQGARGG